MPTLSTIPAAVENILAMFAASPLLAGVDIINGPSVTVEGGTVPGTTSSDKVIWVGWSPNPLVTSAVEVHTVQEGLGGTRDREQYTVHCCTGYIDHDSNMDNAQAQAFSLTAAAREIIAVNRTLSGLQAIARFGAGTITSSQDKNGAKVEVEFDIDVDSYTSYSS